MLRWLDFISSWWEKIVMQTVSNHWMARHFIHIPLLVHEQPENNDEG